MAKISLCMIVKDEAKQLDTCLKSLQVRYEEGLIAYPVDEIIICSNNAEVAKVATKHKAQYFKYKWKDDFSHARNFSFSKAKGDVIFWLDADDVVIGAENLPKLAKLITDGKCDWISLEYLYEKDDQGRVLMRHFKPRLTRKDSGIWKKSVHENFEPVGDVVIARDSSVVIDHQSKNNKDRSGKRNLSILLKEYQKDQENTDPRTLYYLGNTLMAMEKFEEAIPFYTLHVSKCGWPEEKYFSLHYLSHCHAWTGNTDNAINFALEAIKIFPSWSLAYFNLGEYYSMKKDYKKAIEWLLTGLEKDKPDPAVYFTNDLDYTVYPLGRLADAYLYTGNYELALNIAKKLIKENPDDPQCQELLETAEKTVETENFITSFLTVVGKIANIDRIKGAKLFDALPANLDDDIRIQTARSKTIPAKTWEPGSIVIYCDKTIQEWAYPSIFTGTGGSEEAVINMSLQLTKLGHKVVVYCRCGDMRGTYQGVEYRPYYHFNPKDNFDTLIVWRYPQFLNYDLKAKRLYVWLHDIVGPNMFNPRIIERADKFLFLSKWHRNNVPDMPEEKVYITNNGIDPDHFKELSEKRPNSLVYTSSYDRGALTLVRDIFPLIRKEVPDATLHCLYGWDNILKSFDIAPYLKDLYDELAPLLEGTPGVIHHGKVNHKQVARLVGESVVQIYPTEFGETNFIGGMKAQAAGSYLLTTTQSGGVPERIRFGEAMEGNNIYSDKAFQERFAKRAIELLKNPPVISPQQRQAVIEEFSWETTAKAWALDLLGGK